MRWGEWILGKQITPDPNRAWGSRSAGKHPALMMAQRLTPKQRLEFKERSTVLELGRKRQDGHSDSLLGLKPLDLDIDDG